MRGGDSTVRVPSQEAVIIGECGRLSSSSTVNSRLRTLSWSRRGRARGESVTQVARTMAVERMILLLARVHPLIAKFLERERQNSCYYILFNGGPEKDRF